MPTTDTTNAPNPTKPNTNQESTTPPEESRELIQSALDEGATDIHLDSTADNYRLCFRVDGVIQNKKTLDLEEGASLLNQLKVLAKLGVDRAIGPEDSRITWEKDDGKSIGIRVSLLPSMDRESIHLRLLQPPQDILSSELLGMQDEDIEIAKRIMRRPEGLIIVAGPTGAGKTMTMYSLISMLEMENLITASIEDPVEYNLPYIRQIEADPEHGLSMQQGLSSLLRMDPDVLLVGEVRDEQSTLTATQAASSGHFVFTTLHAQAPHLAIAGLRFLQVPDHLLGNTIRLIITQNLVRRLCKSCKTTRDLTDEERAIFKQHDMDAPDKLADSDGCDDCNGYGFKGRTGIFEVTRIDEETGLAIASGASPRELRDLMRKCQSHTLAQAGLSKVANHITSLDEAANVCPLIDNLETSTDD